MRYLIVTDKVITNIIEAEPDIAEKISAKEWYDGAKIGDKYLPPSETDVILDLLADHEYRLCMSELNGGETTK
jgi:hypothetical protein